MAHFQPHAVTISRGEEWRDRRRFNEAVLGGGDQLHPSADRYLETIRQEVGVLRMRPGRQLAWEDLARGGEPGVAVRPGAVHRDDEGREPDPALALRDE
jgi:hypothetical protein